MKEEDFESAHNVIIATMKWVEERGGTYVKNFDIEYLQTARDIIDEFKTFIDTHN